MNESLVALCHAVPFKMATRKSRAKLAFHDADTDTDTDSPDTSIYPTSDTRDFLARILARKFVSVSVSLSAPWNASLLPFLKQKLPAYVRLMSQ